MSEPAAELVGAVGIVYACGPMGMLRAVGELATAAGVPSYVAVEESMACGIGVCMTCVLPVIGEDGRTRFARSCAEGPVFGGDRVRFADVGALPHGCCRRRRDGGAAGMSRLTIGSWFRHAAADAMGVVAP